MATATELKQQVDDYQAQYQEALLNYKNALGEYQSAVTSELPDIGSIVSGFGDAIGALPIDPTKYATTNIQDVLSQQLDASRSIRESIRTQQAEMASTVAQMDLTAAQSYAKQVIDNVPEGFATGFTREALTPITPDSVTNLAAPNFEIGGYGGIFANLLTSGLLGEGMLDGLGGGLSDVSLSGFDLSSIDVTGVDGVLQGGSGIVSKIGTTSLVEGFLTGGVSGAMSSALTSTVSNGITGIVGSQVKGLDVSEIPFASSIASATAGIPLGAGSAYSLLGEAATSAIFSDATGGLFESVTGQVTKNIADSVDTSSGSFFDTIKDSVSNFAKSVSGGDFKSIGGINLEDVTSLVDGTLIDVAKNAVLEGDVSGFEKVIDNFSKNKGIFSTDVINLATNVINNPANISNYSKVLSKLDIDLGSVLTLGGSKTKDATSTLADRALVDSGVITQEQLDSVTTKMNNALDSTMFSRMTTVGKRLLRDNIGDAQYRQFEAVSTVANMAMPQAKNTRSGSSASTNNNTLVRSAERLFNDGKAFQVSKNYPYSKWKLDSDITKSLSNARYILN